MLTTSEDIRAIEDQLFNKLLLEIVDESLTSILGENSKMELYCYLKETVAFDTDNVNVEFAAFHMGIKNLFGSSAIIVENAIIKELFSRIRLDFHKEDDFVDQIKKARTYFKLNKRSIDRMVKKTYAGCS